MLRRVVVTGVGVVSSIGIGREEFWSALLEGKSGISKISSFDTSNFRTHQGGEIKNFNPKKYSDLFPGILKYGRTSQLGVVAAHLALKDAGLDEAPFFEDLGAEDAAIIIGTTNGESQVMEDINNKWVNFGETSIANLDVLKYPSHVIALNIANELNIRASCVVIPTACAAGNYAIGYGYDRISLNETNVAIVGGSDGFSRAAFSGFNSIFAVAPEKCQPFDKNRKGIMVGEGAGILVLEPLEKALKRNATIYAEVLGYGLSCDASHMTIPSVDGIISVMEKAMAYAGISHEMVDYISAHGTGTSMNDKTESKAIRTVFGDRKPGVLVSSIKSMLGHTMGAASALEAIACVLAIKNSKIPPTINYETRDEGCDIDCVPNKMRSSKVDVALNNSFAFGGNNACLVLKKFIPEI